MLHAHDDTSIVGDGKSQEQSYIVSFHLYCSYHSYLHIWCLCNRLILGFKCRLIFFPGCYRAELASYKSFVATYIILTSLVSRLNFSCTPCSLGKKQGLTPTLGKLGHNHKSISACCMSTGPSFTSESVQTLFFFFYKATKCM